MVEFEIRVSSAEGYLPIPLTAVQVEVILKALGLEFENGTYRHFDDETLQRVILPRLNFKAI